MNWQKYFEDFRVSQWPGFNDKIKDHCDDAYHSKILSKEILVITAGDSWTWGDSLDPDLRLRQVYGHKISQTLQADWINIGLSGWSNSWILHHAIAAVENLQKNSYKKIYLILTLTENGRDIENNVSYPYDYLQTRDAYGVCSKLYDKYLADMESFWITQIKKIIEISPTNLIPFISYNFVWHDSVHNYLKVNNIATTEKNWIETLADHQMIPHPPRANLVTGWIFDSLKKVNKIAMISDDKVFKEWSLPYIDKANEVNAWLDASPMNHKKVSKHPNAEAHKIWADYILQKL